MEKRRAKNEGTGKTRGRGANEGAQRIESILNVLKANKVLSFEGEGLKFEISPMAYFDEPVQAPAMSEEELKKKFDDLLYHSTGGH